MKTKPFFSVCIPTRNRRKLLEMAINSVLKQSFQDFEIIVQDNASSDSTEKYCRFLAKKDKRVKYARNKKDEGFVFNTRAVMNRANGKYLFLLGDDDIVVPSGFEIFHSILANKKNNVGAAHCRIFTFFVPKKEDVIRVVLPFTKDEIHKPRSFKQVLDYYATFISGWAIKNEKPLTIGNGHQDAFIETVFQQIQKRNFYFIAQPLVGQGVHNNLGYSFYSFTSPWFELEELMKKYVDAKNLDEALIRVKNCMVDDCHTLKIYGGFRQFYAHFSWFFKKPIPKARAREFLVKSIILWIIPNPILISMRILSQKLGLIASRGKIKELWV